MRVGAVWAAAWLGAGALGCINPYDRFSGEVNAGPVDPIAFPPPYLGGGDRYRTGTGQFVAVESYAAGAPIEYFQFPLSSTQARELTAKRDPLVVEVDGKPVSTVPTPLAYVFDPGPVSPFPVPATCKKPSGALPDDLSYEEQGSIFTGLPSATYTPGVAASWSYVPVVLQVPVTSRGHECQSIKSEKTLVRAPDVMVQTTELVGGKVVGVSDGRRLAWAIIEPGSPVYRADGETPETGVGLQRWGWYQHYLVAYLDGGYIPVEGVDVGGKAGVRLKPQRLYVPRSTIGAGDAAKPGVAGAGYDVLEAKRGAAGYSPVCQVFTYDAGPVETADQLPKDAATITAQFGATVEATSTYFYCLQVE